MARRAATRLACAVLALLSIAGTQALPDLSRVARALGLDRAPQPPRYPASYEVSYNFTLPYERKYLPDGLTFPVRVWRDDASQRVRMDTYGGTNSLLVHKDANLEIFPRVNTTACAMFKNDPGEQGLLETQILPDVSGWDYIGKAAVRGRQAHMWQYSRRHGDKHVAYKFYADASGDPVRLHMHGNDAFSGAHFDVWIADYHAFKPGAQDASVFDPPACCKGARPLAAGQRGSFAARMQALAPAVRAGSVAYDAWLGRLGKAHATQQAYEAGLRAFQQNAALVKAHNADSANRGSRLELNRFADWTQADFEAVMLPRHGQARGLLARKPGGAALPYERLAPPGRIPTAVDWRGSLADLVVKDQAACGSCWAFATTGVLEAAHFLATGDARLFSEQQSMDCSWGHSLNKACDGGDYDAAMDYLKQAGGIAEERSYAYLGADAFCRDGNLSAASLTPFEGYAYVPSGDDAALMEAIYSRGPVAVSLDASQPSFRFYSGGVLDEPSCMWKSEDLDHAVMAFGYGTEAGKDYWLIRNSWSTHWGDGGFVKIARGHHGCGISTDAVYAVFSPKQQQ